MNALAPAVLAQADLAAAAAAQGIALAPGLPRATLRLQLNHRFTFDDARARVPYFQQLGVSHLFVSPILSARAGSMHGYDVVDHGQVNPELGGEEGLRALVDALRAHGMGLIVDVVPNHMAVGGADNARWLDVLEWGRDSRNAGFFDIDWDVPDPLLNGRVLVPFLGAPYGEVLAAGELLLRFEHGRFFVAYHEHRFPLALRSYPGLLAAAPEFAEAAGAFAAALRAAGMDARSAGFDAAVAQLARQAQASPQGLARVLELHDATTDAGRERLHRLLERQHYRLAWWRAAGDEINWRRFFDINALAALRIQDKPVFEAVHATIFRLYAAGLIDGLRIDHVDGLADPRAYCRLLRARLARLDARRPPQAPRGPAYIVVEKILAVGERLAQDWQVDGTSGYSFMNDVGALMHAPDGESAMDRLWVLNHGRDFAEEERRARRRIPLDLFAADFSACALALHRIARGDPATRDWSLTAVRRVLLELLVHFPVYRTYADARGRSAADADIMRRAVSAARRSCRPGDRRLLELIDDWLGGTPPRSLPRAAARRARLHAIARFQQLTSPVAAKAVEDTVFYRHGRLLSRNEVGSDPAQFAIEPEDFHRICADRQRRYPKALLATATHDHKRGEDVRMRLAVLSEQPGAWTAAVTRWRTQAHALRATLPGEDATAVPDETDEYMLFQMLVGTWPPELAADDAQGLGAYAQRIIEWQRKAVREAKRHSSWLEPDEAYERGCEHYVRRLLDPDDDSGLAESIRAFVDAIGAPGAIKSLAQTLIRNTTPGVPDLYQGTEFWDFSMVDPDNRRPVDFERRAAALARTDAPAVSLLSDWTDGAIKQRLLARTLALRARMPLLFAQGAYRGLRLRGAQAHRLLAYARVLGEQACIVVVVRHPSGLLAEDGGLRIDPRRWQDTRVELPHVLARLRWRDALQPDRTIEHGRQLPVATLLDPWPLALLASGDALPDASLDR